MIENLSWNANGSTEESRNVPVIGDSILNPLVVSNATNKKYLRGELILREDVDMNYPTIEVKDFHSEEYEGFLMPIKVAKSILPTFETDLFTEKLIIIGQYIYDADTESLLKEVIDYTSLNHYDNLAEDILLEEIGQDNNNFQLVHTEVSIPATINLHTEYYDVLNSGVIKEESVLFKVSHIKVVTKVAAVVEEHRPY